MGLPVLCNNGRQLLINRLAAGNFYLAWGIGAGSASATQTAAYGEVSPRLPATLQVMNTNVTGDTLRMYGTMTATGSLAISNACVMDALTGGNIFLSADFALVNLSPGDGIAFDWRYIEN